MKKTATEKKMSDVASHLQAIIETTVDGIITIDEKGIIKFVNISTCKIFGYNAEEMIGQNISMLMPSPDHEQHDGYLHSYMATGIKKIIGIGREVKGKKKDETVFPFWLSISEVNLENNKMFTGVIHDLTEQKSAEEALIELNKNLEKIVVERTEKLSEVVNKLLTTNQHLQHEVMERKAAEQSMLTTKEELQRTQELLKKIIVNLRDALKKEKELGALKTRFMALASHEFRTPLTAILSSASLAEKYTHTEQQDNRKKHYQKIQSAVKTLTSILDDFMSVSRLDESKIAVHYEAVNFKSLYSEVSEEINSVLKPRQKITLHLYSDEIVLKTDKKLMKMILSNLLTNASKYSDEGAEIKCLGNKSKEFIEINIIDHGIGIPDEDKLHLFDRFFRASNVTNIKGTGLGLNIAKRYVELMGGTLECQSELGKGSTFTIRFKNDIL